MVRNIIGSVLAVIGAAAAVASPFQAWYDGRHGRDYRVEDLFNGITGTSSDLWVSLLLPLAFAALVTLIGLVLRSRLLVALSGLIVLGFTVLWMVRQGQDAGDLTLTSDGTGLGLGVACASGGGVLLLIAAAVMSGRRHRGRGRGGGGGHRYAGDGRDRERDHSTYDRDYRYGDEQPPVQPPPVQPPGSGSTEQHVWRPEPRTWDTREQPWEPPPPDDSTRRPHGT
ncbi:hypothetical protein OG292_23485 [Streptomyces sp. NBC_01511]|uniref:hypothetical protein n=1 Tax=Streptomyces sp. NBC_01511 TaxID=2903889 RepID=UPI00386C2625